MRRHCFACLLFVVLFASGPLHRGFLAPGQPSFSPQCPTHFQSADSSSFFTSHWHVSCSTSGAPAAYTQQNPLLPHLECIPHITRIVNYLIFHPSPLRRQENVLPHQWIPRRCLEQSRYSINISSVHERWTKEETDFMKSITAQEKQIVVLTLYLTCCSVYCSNITHTSF